MHEAGARDELSGSIDLHGAGVNPEYVMPEVGEPLSHGYSAPTAEVEHVGMWWQVSSQRA